VKKPVPDNIVFSFRVGEYEVSIHDDRSLWLVNQEGEGMTMWNQELAAFLDQYFKENF